VGTIIDRADFSRIPPMPYASFAAARRTPWRPFASFILYSDPVSGREFILKISAAPIHADARLCRGDQNAIRPPSQGETLCELTIYGLIRSFNSKRFSFHRARDRQIAQARGRRTSARQAPHDSRPASMSCAIEPACFVSGDSPGSDLPHEVHRIWNHFPSASVYQKTPTQKGAAEFFYPSPKKRESTLISRGFAAFVSSHLYSMSSRLDTKRNRLRASR
jgi:hypothetical protein